MPRGRKKLPLEEKLRRERERWTRNNRKRAKESANSKWMRATNFGYFDGEVKVLHWGALVEYLIWRGYLDEMDADDKTRIDAAADALLLDYVEDRAANYGSSTFAHYCGQLVGHNYSGGEIGLRGPHPDFRAGVCDGIGEVRIKIAMPLVEALGLENECDNRRKVRKAIEELLFRIYSNIADRADPVVPRGGENTQWMRPLWSPLESNREKWLRQQGIIGDQTTAFRQDEFLTPEGGNVPPGSIWNSGGLMEGKRALPKRGRGADDFGPEDFEQ